MKHNLPKVTCPYCNHKQSLHLSTLRRIFDFSDTHNRIKCSRCGRRFIIRVEVYEISGETKKLPITFRDTPRGTARRIPIQFYKKEERDEA